MIGASQPVRHANARIVLWELLGVASSQQRLCYLRCGLDGRVRQTDPASLPDRYRLLGNRCVDSLHIKLIQKTARFVGFSVRAAWMLVR